MPDAASVAISGCGRVAGRCFGVHAHATDTGPSPSCWSKWACPVLGPFQTAARCTRKAKRSTGINSPEPNPAALPVPAGGWFARSLACCLPRGDDGHRQLLLQPRRVGAATSRPRKRERGSPARGPVSRGSGRGGGARRGVPPGRVPRGGVAAGGVPRRGPRHRPQLLPRRRRLPPSARRPARNPSPPWFPPLLQLLCLASELSPASERGVIPRALRAFVSAFRRVDGVRPRRRWRAGGAGLRLRRHRWRGGCHCAPPGSTTSHNTISLFLVHLNWAPLLSDESTNCSTDDSSFPVLTPLHVRCLRF
jgi:hypothetical protein